MTVSMEKIPHPRSVIWRDDRLLLLDQRRLPTETIYLELTTPEEVREAIVKLAVRGAPAIGTAAAFGMYLGVKDIPDADAGRFWSTLRRVGENLRSARPTAVNLAWALERIRRRLETLKEHPVSELKAALLAEAHAIQREDADMCRKIGEHLLTLLEDGMGVLTHCNAGGLATAAYGTALAPLYLAKERGWHLRVFADETRPVLQGARLTAYELQQAGIDVTLICDNMAAPVMQKGWVQAVIVGTDRVAANGDVANKIGTYGLAVLAKAHGIPFYVAAPTSSIDLQTPTGSDIPIEERPAEEVTRGFGSVTAPEGVRVYNPAFDVTPAELVTAIITEHGVIRQPFGPGLQEAVQRSQG